MPIWLEPLIGALLKYQAEIRRFLKVLTRQPVALAVSITLLVASVALTYVYWMRSARYEAVVTNTIGSTMEATEQENKGLEAFIFSNVRKHVDDAVRAAPLNSKFIKQYHAFHESLLTAVSGKSVEKESEVALVVPQNSNHQVLSDPDQNYAGFLFLPTFLLHANLPVTDVEKLTTGASLILHTGSGTSKSDKNSAVVNLEDRGMLRAVVLTRILASNIQGLADQPLIADNVDTEATRYLNRHPAQVYIITKEGLNRVFTQGQPHPAHEFGNQFPSNTFFPSRPYFWPAVHEQESGERQKAEPVAGESIGSFFHVSKPYLDLGGSGVVITLSRALELDDITTAVICFDLQFDVSQNLYAALENNVRELSGTPLEVDCTVPTDGDPDCEGHAKPGESAPKQFSDSELRLVKKVKDRLGESKEDYARSKVLGTLSRFDESESKVSPSRVIFSLPMDRKFLADGTQKAKLLVVDLDVNDYKQTTTLIALTAASCFGLTTVVLAYLWGSNVMRRREFETSFGRMAEVMYNSPTPYLRLDSKDQISDVSESFCTLVGVSPTADAISELKKKTFRSFLADQASLSEYDRVEAARKRNEHVAPYVLTLRKSTGALTTVRIISAAVPATEEDKLPQTFGILVELGRPAPLQVEVPEKPLVDQTLRKVM